LVLSRAFRGSSRLFLGFVCVGLAYFAFVTLLVHGLLPEGLPALVLELLLEAGFLAGTALLFARHMDRQARRMRRVNETLEARVSGRTEELRREVAERARAEETLRLSEQRLRDIAEAASDWLWEIGADLRFKSVSKRFLDTTGLPLDNILDRSPDQVFLPAEAGDEPLTEGWLRKHRPFRDVALVMQTDLGPRIMTLSGRPVFEANGVFAGYRGTGSDITERRQMEQEVERMLRRHEQILTSLGEGVFGLDQDGAFTFVNPAAQEALGWTGPELAGKVAERILTPEPGNGLAILPGPRLRLNNNATFRCRDGRILPVAFVWTAIVEDGELTGAVVAFRDITEQKRAAAELVAAKERAEASTRAKSDFLAHISHELRTPLNSIVGFADVMRAEMFGPVGNDRYKDYLADIGHSAGHLTEIIDDLVDLARIEAGKLELDPAPTDVAVVVEEALAIIRPQAISANVSLLNNVLGNLPLVSLDAKRLKQVLLNLLSNAVKFSPAGGRVAISTEVEPDGSLLVRVADTGMGIPEEDLDKVIRTFAPGVRETTRDKGGVGLGLPLAKQLMELQGGGLSLASKLNEGTVVTLRLPRGQLVQPDLEHGSI